MGPTSIQNINADAFAATLQMHSGERQAFDTLFLNGGTMNRNRAPDRERLSKLADRDTVAGKPGLLARALKQSRALFDADAFADELAPGTGEYHAFETIFVHRGTMNQNRLGDREKLLKLKAKDIVGGKPGLLARALIQFGV